MATPAVKTLSVFLVDDDEDDRTIFCEVLNEILPSVACITFNNGEEVLNELNSTTTPPDFIFLDLNMPRINGKQCLEIIKKSNDFSLIPVIIYTTSKLSKDMEDTKDLGADYFITKPSNLDQLKKELEFVMQNNWRRSAGN